MQMVNISSSALTYKMVRLSSVFQDKLSFTQKIETFTSFQLQDIYFRTFHNFQQFYSYDQACGSRTHTRQNLTCRYFIKLTINQSVNQSKCHLLIAVLGAW